jgi:hypothetical protein
MPRRALPYLAAPRQASLYERICHGGRHLITSCKVTGRHGPGRGRRFFAHFAWAGALSQRPCRAKAAGNWRPASPGQVRPPASSKLHQLQQSNAEIRSDNHTLRGQLDVVIAHIQRLTLENHQLRAQLEDTRHITRIRVPRPPLPRP